MEQKPIALACRMDSERALFLAKDIFNYLSQDKEREVVLEQIRLDKEKSEVELKKKQEELEQVKKEYEDLQKEIKSKKQFLDDQISKEEEIWNNKIHLEK